MCLFVNKLYWFGVVGLCTLGVNKPGRASSFLNRLYWFGVIGLCTLGVDYWGRASSFLNRLYLFGVVGLCTLGLDWGVHLHCVYPYFSIGSAGLV